MKGNKIKPKQSIRPSSANISQSSRGFGYIPGVTAPIYTDMAQLFIESKQKELEYEKSKSKLMLHTESKRSKEERDILSEVIIKQKYDETIQALTESHSNRMKALSQQHENATKTLMEQFKNEVSALKASHKIHIDHLINDMNEQLQRKQEEIEDLKYKQKQEIEEIENLSQKQLQAMKEELENAYKKKLKRKEEELEKKEYEFCEKISKERDEQIKEVINKIYGECRKEQREKENKLQEEVRNLNAELENWKIKYEKSIKREEKIKINNKVIDIGSSLEKNNMKPRISDEYFFEISEFEALKDDKETQTELINHDIDTQANLEIDITVEMKEHEDRHALEIAELEEKVTEILRKKNANIQTLESQLRQSIVRCKELEALIKQLKASW